MLGRSGLLQDVVRVGRGRRFLHVSRELMRQALGEGGGRHPRWSGVTGSGVERRCSSCMWWSKWYSGPTGKGGKAHYSIVLSSMVCILVGQSAC